MKLSSGVLCLTSLVLGSIHCFENSLQNVKLIRTLILTEPTQVKEVVQVVVKNVGSKPITNYVLSISEDKVEKVGYILAKLKVDKTELTVKKTNLDNIRGVQFYEVNLGQPLLSDQKVVLSIQSVYLNSTLNLPKLVQPGQEAKLAYSENLYFSSPYPTLEQKTLFKVTTDRGLEYDEVDPVEFKSEKSQLVYGPFHNVAAFSFKLVKVHFIHTRPMLYSTRVKKVIYLSHWSDGISVEEHHAITNLAPGLKGEYSQALHRMFKQQGRTQHFVEDLELSIPKLATSAYYRDEIGNVSTSNFKEGATHSPATFQIRPRYPIYGGWAYTFYFGYHLPLNVYLKTKDYRRFTFNLPTLNTFHQTASNQVQFEIVLPEGASQIELPQRVQAQFDLVETKTTYSYFDTIGRNTIILTKFNTVPEQWPRFEVKYTLQPHLLLLKPIAITLALFATFILAMVFTRVSFNKEISPTTLQNKAKKSVKLEKQ